MSFISNNVGGRKKTKKKEKVARLKLDFDDSVSVLCKLCNKEQPIQFSRNEEAIKNIPVQNMTPFLEQMKSDLLAKAPYLKFLKLSSKFIKACECKHPVHAYCITAQVIRNACVYCKKCGCQYKVFVKQE